jgi:hypothetical protein
VCTVAEARDVMLRLADALKVHLEDPSPPPPLPTLAEPPAPPPHIVGPIVAAMIGGVAIAVGAAVLGTLGSCDATTCSQNRTRSAIGGGLIGAGAVMTFVGAYVTIERSRPAGAPAPATTISLALRF